MNDDSRPALARPGDYPEVSIGRVPDCELEDVAARFWVDPMIMCIARELVMWRSGELRFPAPPVPDPNDGAFGAFGIPSVAP